MKDQFKAGGVVLEKALGFRVYRVNQLLRAALYRAFEGAMTPEQWIVLVRLWERGEAGQSELAADTLKDKATLSRILEVLERDGLVARRADPEDSRGRRVKVTAKATALRPRAVAAARALLRRAERGIPAEDLEVTRRTLLRLERNLLEDEAE